MRRIFPTAVVLFAITGVARPDALVVTQAMKAATICEIFIEKTQVRVEFEVGLADLEKFRNLMPDGILGKMNLPPEPFEERFAKFHTVDFVLEADGQTLVPRVTRMEPRDRVERDGITGEPLAAGGEPEQVVFTELSYPFEGEPESLVMTPGRITGIGFMTYHLGLPVMEFRYLSMAHTLTLDWEDPWYSEFAHRNLQRTHRYPISAFLYIEPYEIRVEVIVRPRDLQEWVDLGLAGRDTIPIEAQGRLEEKAAEFLAEHVALSIDGEDAKPRLDRLHFLERTLRSSSVITPRRELSVHSAVIGAIFVHPVNGLPREAGMHWDLFSPKLQTVSAAATDEAGPLPARLTPDDPVLTWKNFLKNPTVPGLVAVTPPPRRTSPAVPWLLGIGALAAGILAVRVIRRHAFCSRPGLLASGLALALCAGVLVTSRPPRPNEGESRRTIHALLRNIYHAFDFRGEEEIYDTLARSVHGPLLETAYLEVRKGLRLANQGGAQVKVKEVGIEELEPLPSQPLQPGFRVVWTVTGSVGHWGHIHQRRNKYQGEIRIEAIDGEWKLVTLDLASEERME